MSGVADTLQDTLAGGVAELEGAALGVVGAVCPAVCHGVLLCHRDLPSIPGIAPLIVITFGAVS